ncbi:MAG: cell wall metabolism sensor histidine kinase WalK [Spirosomaceae bacterium]|nr:cell wall metabolism sensor histidine kinase WalK [Spirosomataceae bacterium]
MKIKTKLRLGVGLLFLLIVLLSLVGAKYSNTLKQETQNILVANYNSVQYAQNMLRALENTDAQARAVFEKNLRLQENNITEGGEQEITQSIRAGWGQVGSSRPDSAALSGLRKAILAVIEMNMRAIERKSTVAKATADEAVLWIVLTGTVCFLIAFSLLVNLPSNIANPLQELTESIKQIAANNYTQRVHFGESVEFKALAESFNTMAEQLEAYNKSSLAKLLVEKKRIETLINNMHDPVIGLDEHWKVVFANQEALKIMGLPAADFVGKAAQDVAIRNDLIRTLLQDLLDQKQAPPAEPMKIYADGKESYFEKEIVHISAIPAGETQPQVIGHVIILRNVTAYKALDFAKTNFIATVSHEFKTPISSIKMSLQLLENKQLGNLNDEQQQLVESIKDDTNRLLKITSELLNMTQVESGNIQLNLRPTPPQQLLDYALEATKNQAEQKQIKIETSLAHPLPLVQADPEKTAWVLTNLIANAIRFSYDNAVIFIDIIQTENEVKIAVKDTGRGIEAQYQDKIFDRYFRVPGTQKEGTGLGLAISKEFMEAQGGRISVESELGVGSTFSIFLLLTRAEG